MPKKKKSLCIVCGEETDQVFRFKHGSIAVHEETCINEVNYHLEQKTVSIVHISYGDLLYQDISTGPSVQTYIDYAKEDRRILNEFSVLAADAMWEDGPLVSVFEELKNLIILQLENHYIAHIPLEELPKINVSDLIFEKSKEVLKRRLKGDSIEILEEYISKINN
jgi:hypothetical protein